MMSEVRNAVSLIDSPLFGGSFGDAAMRDLFAVGEMVGRPLARRNPADAR